MESNQAPKKKKKGWKKFRNITLFILVAGLSAFVGIRYYYPFGEGVKTGQLNYVVHKGVIFKTYEGKLIQSGFRTTASSGISSNEFEFSVKDKILADSLMRAGGQIVELRYKEYFGTLPWRGYSRYVVDKILKITPASAYPTTDYPPVVPEG